MARPPERHPPLRIRQRKTTGDALGWANTRSIGSPKTHPLLCHSRICQAQQTATNNTDYDFLDQLHIHSCHWIKPEAIHPQAIVFYKRFLGTKLSGNDTADVDQLQLPAFISMRSIDANPLTIRAEARMGINAPFTSVHLGQVKIAEINATI